MPKLFRMMELGQSETDRMRKKRKVTEEGRKAKKRKLDPLVDWGVGDMEDAKVNEESREIRRWLGLEVEVNIEPENDVEISCRKYHEHGKLKQMELNFARILDNDSEDYIEKVSSDDKEGDDIVEPNKTSKAIKGDKPTKKRRQTLKQLASSNLKVTSWMKPSKTPKIRKTEEMEIDDADWPEVEEPATVMRREVAKEKSRKSKVMFLCRNVVESVVDQINARSVVSRMLEQVMDRSVWRIRIGEVWRLLEEDKELQSVILKKVRRQEREVTEAVERSDRLERKLVAKDRWRTGYMERQMDNLEELMACLTVCREELGREEYGVQTEVMDWTQTEMVEHSLLDDLIGELGIQNMDMSRTSEVDFEQEMEYLEMLGHDNGGEEADLDMMSSYNVKYAGGMLRNIGDEDLEYDWLEEPGVNTRAYYTCGTWFLNNWVRGHSESGRMDMSHGGRSDAREYVDISGVDRSSKFGALSTSVVSSAIRLIMFSIVGTESSTRKRTFLSRKGRWLSTSSWCPVPRRTTPWRARRRSKQRSGTEVTSLAESSKMTMSDYVEEDMLVELNINKSINIAGAEEQHLHQKVDNVSMVLESSKEDEIVAMECDMIAEQKEEFNARKLATSLKSQFSYYVTGRDTEAGGQAGQTAGVQAGLNEDGGPWNDGEGHAHDHGGKEDGQSAEEHEEGGLWNDGEGPGRDHAGLGDGQSAEEHVVHGQPRQDRQTTTTIGDGFRSQFRKIARAKRTYSGVPDGLIQMRFSDFFIKGTEATFTHLGGGSSQNILESKKRKVEREHFLRIKKYRPG